MRPINQPEPDHQTDPPEKNTNQIRTRTKNKMNQKLNTKTNQTIIYMVKVESGTKPEQKPDKKPNQIKPEHTRPKYQTTAH